MFASSGLSKQQKMKTALVGILTALLLAFAGQSSAAPTDTNCQSVCPAGYHIDPDSSVTSPCQDGEIPCTPCEDHTFVDVPNTGYSCFPHYICRSFEIEIEKGTRSTNTKCVCKQNLYKSMGGDCLPWTKCKKGYGVVRQGSSEVNVQCQECVNGTFSDTENSFSQCRNHTRCEDDFEVETPGSKESDTKCIRISEINPSANLPTTPSANPTSFVTKETSNPSLSSLRNSTQGITTGNVSSPEPHGGNANIWMGIGIGGMMVAVIIILAIVIHKLKKKRRKKERRQSHDFVEFHPLEDTRENQQNGYLHNATEGPGYRSGHTNGQPPTSDQANGIPPTTNGGPQTVVTITGNNMSVNIKYDSRSPPSGCNTSASTDTVSTDKNSTDCNERDDEDNSVPAKGMQETESPKDDGASASGLQETESPRADTDTNSNAECAPQVHAQCTQDNEGNIDDLHEKEAGYAVPEIPVDENSTQGGVEEQQRLLQPYSKIPLDSDTDEDDGDN